MADRSHPGHRHVPTRPIRALTFLALLALLALAAPSATFGATTCERTFTGDATGSRDVTASLTAFLDKHGGKRLCLKSYGKYRVDGTVRITNEYGLRLNGRSAILRPAVSAASSAQRQQLRIQSGRNIIISNLTIRGINPNFRRWSDARQHEHGIAIYGGASIKLINIIVRDTYGDGIYVGYDPGRIPPATGITMGPVDIARVGRNGVAIVGGSYLVVTDAKIAYTGLHSVDLEPDLAEANIHHVTVKRSSLRSFGQAGIWTGYAFAAVGTAGQMRSISVVGNRAERFQALVANFAGDTHEAIAFTNNRSTLSSRARFENVQGLTFSGNVNISIQRVNVN
jgi:hypothetical protein